MSILTLRRIQEVAWDSNAPIVVAYIDIKKAFDSPPRQLILDGLRMIGCPPALLSIVEQLHTDVRCTVQNNEDATFTMDRGVRQGCCLGPILFIILYEILLRLAELDADDLGVELTADSAVDGVNFPNATPAKAKFSVGTFADDCVILATSTPPLQRALNR